MKKGRNPALEMLPGIVIFLATALVFTFVIADAVVALSPDITITYTNDQDVNVSGNNLVNDNVISTTIATTTSLAETSFYSDGEIQNGYNSNEDKNNPDYVSNDKNSDTNIITGSVSGLSFADVEEDETIFKQTTTTQYINGAEDADKSTVTITMTTTTQTAKPIIPVVTTIWTTTTEDLNKYASILENITELIPEDPVTTTMTTTTVATTVETTTTSETTTTTTIEQIIENITNATEPVIPEIIENITENTTQHNITIPKNITKLIEPPQENLSISTRIIQTQNTVSLTQGEMLNVNAKLVYENETPIQGQTLTLYLGKSFVKSGTTNTEGWVEIGWNTSKIVSGNYIINITYEGTTYASPSFNDTGEIEILPVIPVQPEVIEEILLPVIVDEKVSATEIKQNEIVRLSANVFDESGIKNVTFMLFDPDMTSREITAIENGNEYYYDLTAEKVGDYLWHRVYAYNVLEDGNFSAPEITIHVGKILPVLTLSDVLIEKIGDEFEIKTDLTASTIGSENLIVMLSGPEEVAINNFSISIREIQKNMKQRITFHFPAMGSQTY